MNIKKIIWMLTLFSCCVQSSTQENHQVLSKAIHDFYTQDQLIRKKLIQSGFSDKKIVEEITMLDKKSSQFIRSTISRYGWPERNQLKPDTYHQFMTLVIHSPDKELMQQVFVHVLHDFLHDKGTDYQTFAIYVDKVFLQAHGYQIFGTQYDFPPKESHKTAHIWNKANLDERRKTLNLMPFNTYQEMVQHMSSKKNSHVSKQF